MLAVITLPARHKIEMSEVRVHYLSAKHVCGIVTEDGRCLASARFIARKRADELVSRIIINNFKMAGPASAANYNQHPALDAAPAYLDPKWAEQVDSHVFEGVRYTYPLRWKVSHLL